MPPNTVGPFEEVIWACGGTMWGRSNAGVVRYSQGYDGGNGSSAGRGGESGSNEAKPTASNTSQTVTIEWDNPWVLRPPVEDIRRFEATVSSRRCVAEFFCYSLSLSSLSLSLSLSLALSLALSLSRCVCAGGYLRQLFSVEFNLLAQGSHCVGSHVRRRWQSRNEPSRVALPAGADG